MFDGGEEGEIPVANWLRMHLRALRLLNSPEWLGNSDMIEVRTY